MSMYADPMHMPLTRSTEEPAERAEGQEWHLSARGWWWKLPLLAALLAVLLPVGVAATAIAVPAGIVALTVRAIQIALRPPVQS